MKKEIKMKGVPFRKKCANPECGNILPEDARPNKKYCSIACVKHDWDIKNRIKKREYDKDYARSRRAKIKAEKVK